jgi:flagellar basal-body rod protein FlgG
MKYEGQMIQGLYAAATGLKAVDDRQSAIANNIANASTIGFKRQRPVQEGFYNIFSDHLINPFHFQTKETPGGGSMVSETYTDFSGGIFQRTGNPLNVALQGPGYFGVETPQGERFTRAGNFSVNSEGLLVTSEGDRVQNADGRDIDVRGGRITIDTHGVVTVDGAVRGRLRLIEFENPHQLTRTGDNMFQASDATMAKSTDAADTLVAQEHLEMSNVNLPREMIDMTLGMRAYAANQKVMNAMDETMSRVIDQVGMPA